MKSDRVLLCGGTGFIGQQLALRLVKEGYKLNLLVHKSAPKNLEGLKNITFFKGDMLKKETLKSALENSEVIINLVGSFYDIYQSNILANFNILDLCKKNNKKMIFTSSGLVYGECSKKPAIESQKPKPKTEYALTKYLAENIYKFYSENYNVPSVILRLSNVYGQGQRAGVIFNFINAILNDEEVIVNNNGSQKRDFLYVDDAVAGIIKALNYTLNGKNKFEIFNISGQRTYTLLEVISTVEQITGKKANIKFRKYDAPDVHCTWQDFQKASSLLGYSPKKSLTEGIRETIKSSKCENLKPKVHINAG